MSSWFSSAAQAAGNLTGSLDTIKNSVQEYAKEVFDEPEDGQPDGELFAAAAGGQGNKDETYKNTSRLLELEAQIESLKKENLELAEAKKFSDRQKEEQCNQFR